VVVEIVLVAVGVLLIILMVPTVYPLEEKVGGEY